MRDAQITEIRRALLEKLRKPLSGPVENMDERITAADRIEALERNEGRQAKESGMTTFTVRNDDHNTIWLNIHTTSGLRCAVPAAHKSMDGVHDTVAARVFKELAAASAAADHIETLERENARLREALVFACGPHFNGDEFACFVVRVGGNGGIDDCLTFIKRKLGERKP